MRRRLVGAEDWASRSAWFEMNLANPSSAFHPSPCHTSDTRPGMVGAQADFFFSKRNGITFPSCSGGIHFVGVFLKVLGT